MKKIRILYLIDDLFSLHGGSEQHLGWLLNNIPDSDFQKHFIIFSSFWRPETASFPLEPIILGKKFGIGYRTWLRRLGFLIHYVRKHNIQIIHAFSPRGELAAILSAIFSRQCVVIGNRRDCRYDQRLLYHFIFKLSWLLNAKYIANSEAAKQAAYESDGTPRVSITVIRNPIAFDRIQAGLSQSRNYGALPDPEKTKNGKIIGMVATVRPIKDHATLIRAAKIVIEKIPDIWLLFVGEQESNQKELLEMIAKNEGVASRIIWIGGIDNPLALVPSFDVAVLSSHSESFSNAVLEYAAAGRPIVVSDVGGLGEIIQDGISGFTIPSGDPMALADKIIKIIEDPQLSKRLGENARNYVTEKYNEQKILSQYIAYYKNMLEQHRA